jgi:hypothetical protein
LSDHHENGVALVIVMMTITLLTALGAALTLATITETAIAANYRDATEALYAAEAAVEFAMQEIAAVPDWSDVISESGRSAFVDDPADGIRTVGAVTLDLTQETRDVNAIAAAAPGAASPARVLYAFGRFQDLVPSSLSRSQIYVAVWVADRSETPGDETSVPEALSILGQAYGPQGSRRSVEAIVTKADTSTIRALSWREWR